MFVISRRVGEKIVIGDNITLTVTDIDRGKVRIGIEAPKDICVHREEVYRALHGDTPKVEICARCPDPRHPSPEHHPGGCVEHVPSPNEGDGQ